MPACREEKRPTETPAVILTEEIRLEHTTGAHQLLAGFKWVENPGEADFGNEQNGTDFEAEVVGGLMRSFLPRDPWHVPSDRLLAASPVRSHYAAAILAECESAFNALSALPSQRTREPSQRRDPPRGLPSHFDAWVLRWTEGRTISAVVPSPGRLVSPILPRWASMSPRAMESPNPLPRTSRGCPGTW